MQKVSSLDEAVEELRRDPRATVELEVGGLHIAVRALPGRSAADVFHEIGPWEGESTDELLRRLAEARGEGRSWKEPPGL
jgi:hypothetical protein